MNLTRPRLVVAAPALLLYLALVWLLGRWLDLTGANLWILRVGLGLLGIAATALVLWFAGSRDAGASGPGVGPEADEELDTAVAAARTRLATARAGSLTRLPMVLVLGPEGGAKTSTIAHSGLEAELLAGEVFRGDRIAPTRAANLWYAQRCLVVEGGGALTREPARWARLLQHVTPGRFTAALTGRALARRVVVVCMSCEEFLKPGSAHAVPAAARDLRALVTRMAEVCGIQLPVYVLFTKADRVPGFAEFVRHLSRDEAQQGLGVTLRWPARTPVGVWVDREFQRLNEAFHGLFNSLALSRLELLPREGAQEAAAAAYEFPRELRKLAPLVTQFLVDLCRPSQLEVAPVLRGFYFSGVRPIVVRDAAAPPPALAAGPAGGRMLATEVFDPRRYQAGVPAAPAAPVVGGSRKVPEWVFLGGLFRDVILRDRAALAVARGSVHVQLWRRALLAGLTTASLVWLFGLWTSYFNNRRLAAGAFDAARGLVNVASSEPALPASETLAGLERLRQPLERLADYERNGAPLRFRWGLYQGGNLYRELRRTYYDRFQAVLLDPARAALARALASVPDAPRETVEYGRVYNLLKAYLMTTTHADRIEGPFLAPLVRETWLNRRQIDSTRLDLARRQFDFYAHKLCVGYACAAAADVSLVARTRAFLLTFSGPERIYRVIVAEGSARNPGVRLDRRFPGSAAVLADPYEVPGVFTPAGWDFMRRALGNLDQFQGEEWVVGAPAATQLDRAQLVERLRATYEAEYVRQWRTLLDSASLVPFGGVSDAARKLAVLGGNQSPLLQLLWLTAQNTRVDSQTVGAAFQPVHLVTPPTITDKYVSEGNQAYMSALTALQATVAQAATVPPDAAQALMTQTFDAARAAKGAVAQLALGFRIEGQAAQVGAAVRDLLEEPITRVERLLGNLPVASLNQRGAAFCSAFQPVKARYPFTPTSLVPASLPEVAAVFKPGDGALSRFYSEVLQSVLVRQGMQYAPAPGASPRPTAAFVSFFNRAAAVSDALWPAGATEPRFDFTFRPVLSDSVPVVTFSMDGQTGRFTRTSAAARRFSWVGTGAREVRLSAQIQGREEILLSYDGTWAVFKLFQRAGWRAAGAGYILLWTVPFQGRSVRLEAELSLGGAPPFLRSDYFAGMGCISRVVQ
ncbi:MAG: ImcF-related family protein [Gemmatimonadales bacterium]